jgi:hypothetical protein
MNLIKRFLEILFLRRYRFKTYSASHLLKGGVPREKDWRSHRRFRWFWQKKGKYEG